MDFKQVNSCLENLKELLQKKAEQLEGENDPQKRDILKQQIDGNKGTNKFNLKLLSEQIWQQQSNYQEALSIKILEINNSFAK